MTDQKTRIIPFTMQDKDLQIRWVVEEVRRVQSHVNNALHTKVLEIGDWNMDATASVNVAHGLSDITKFRVVSIIIQRDASVALEPLDYAGSAGTSQGWFNVGTTNVGLSRLSGGVFDSVNYDSTSFNRGWITITYEI